MDGTEWVEKRAAKKKILFGPRVPITAAHVGCRKEKTSSPSSHHAFILILCCFDQTMAAERSTLPTLPHANSRDIKIQSIEMEVWCYSSRHLLCVESCWCETKQPQKKKPQIRIPSKKINCWWGPIRMTGLSSHWFYTWPYCKSHFHFHCRMHNGWQG